MRELLTAILFFLPAGVANMMPPIANKIPGLNRWRTPIDCGKKFRSKRLLGPNKTWRGLTVGTVAAGLVAILEYAVLSSAHTLTIYTDIFVLGLILGFGALAGDAIESFFKRLAGVPAGHSWFLFDQLDYIAGGLLFIYPFMRPSLTLMIWVVVIYFGLHLLVSYIGYLLGFKDQPI